MIDHGGLFLSKSLREELQVAAKACKVSKAELNVVDKRMILTDLTVGLPGQKDAALRIGRVYLSWDSYTRPSVTFEVDDVELLVDFCNVLLTRTNW